MVDNEYTIEYTLSKQADNTAVFCHREIYSDHNFVLKRYRCVLRKNATVSFVILGRKKLLYGTKPVKGNLYLIGGQK